MHETIMKKNYAKNFKIVAVLAVLLALFSAIVIPINLSQQISDFTAMEQTIQMDMPKHHDHDMEDLWKSQITPLSAANYAVIGGTFVLWLALFAYYWLLVVAWLYKSAVNASMNKSLWSILGLFTNLLAVFAFLIVRDSPRRAKAQTV